MTGDTQHYATTRNSSQMLFRIPRFSLAMLFVCVTVMAAWMGLLQWRHLRMRELQQGVAWAESIGGNGSVIDNGHYFENVGLHLDLQVSQLTDEDLRVIASFVDVHHLDLEGTSITDYGLRHLEGCRGLTYLNLHGTQVTRAAIDRLVRRLGYAPKIRLPSAGMYDPARAINVRR